MRTLFVIGIVTLGVVVGPWPIGVATSRVAELEAVLADWRLGCGGCPMRLGWEDRQLSVFVAGRLASLGFSVELARSGEERWVLVWWWAEGGERVVLPVLPGFPPLDREGQFTRGVFLGRVPWRAPGQIDPWYLSPEELVSLPENTPPSVRLRVYPAQPQTGDVVWFTADVDDPDGVVVQALWEFGDGETSTWWSPEHVYHQEGVYTVTLTVVDDRGAVGRSAAVLHVVLPVGGPSPQPPGGGCGCGG